MPQGFYKRGATVFRGKKDFPASPRISRAETTQLSPTNVNKKGTVPGAVITVEHHHAVRKTWVDATNKANVIIDFTLLNNSH